MHAVISRIILYVQDVEHLKHFYQTHLALELSEEISGEWVVLKAGAMELALHRVGPAYRESLITTGTQSNSKLVFTIDAGLEAVREAMLSAGVIMQQIKRYEGFPYAMCDGVDPEGNVFQLVRMD